MSQGFTSQLPIPLPVAQGGTGVTTSTGTGSTVLSTSPALTTPRIGTINDASQNLPIISTSNPASAVNYFTIAGQSTGLPPEIQVTGSDTNIGLNLRTKGTGGFQFLSQALTSPLTIYNGTSGQHSTGFIFSNTAANQTVTFPDRTASINMGLATGGIQAWVNFNGTGTVAIRASSNVTSITDNGTGDYTVNYTTALSSADYAFVGTGSYYSGNYRGSVIISMSGTSTATLYSTTQTRFLTDNAQTDARQDAGYICCATFL